MIQLSDLSLQRGRTLLLDHTNVTLHHGWHIGCMGRNGCGKSSFFSMLRNELAHDSGELLIPKEWEISHMEQEITALGDSALAYVLSGDEELTSLQAALKVATDEDNHEQMAAAHQQLDVIDAYTAEARASTLLHGLGFSQEQHELAVSTFSGGWQMRLNLARTLMCRSDLLLLDEPTNHLDLNAILWLEQWLIQYPGTLIIISHDRDFLDNTIQHTLHFDQQQIHYYKGNYSAAEKQRVSQLAVQAAAFKKQQATKAHLEDFVRRFKAKASKAKQAQSRVKALEKMEIIAEASIDSPFTFSFSNAEQPPHTLINIEESDCGYFSGQEDKDNITILKNVDLRLQPDTRIALLGANGAGKSTLIKSIVGSQDWLSGEQQTSPQCRIGYFAQHQVDQLDLSASPLTLLTRITPNAKELVLRSYLGSFNFHGDDVNEACQNFSGGEKARLALALIVYQNPNVLLLDEPTNHLDLQMRDALTMALQSFQGALILVTHDRHLLRSCTDSLFLVAEGKVGTFDGDLDDYIAYIQGLDKPSSDNDSSENGSANNKKNARQQAAAQRQQLAPLKKSITKIEKRIATLETQKDEVHEQLSDTEIYSEENKDKLQQLLLDQGKVNDALEALETEWMELQEELDQAEAKL